MPGGQIKKLYILQILDILKKYSDVDHPLLQKDIVQLMKRDFGVECERKAVGRNIENLRDLGYDIEYDDGYYLVDKIFEESELRLLVDAVLASRYIPVKQAKDLIDKLTSQASVYFRNKVRHISNLRYMEHQNSNDLFYNIDILTQAIEEKKQVLFFYKKYNTKKQLIYTTDWKHQVNPYQIVLANGRYYLVGNIDKYDNITHFRVERISEIELTDSTRKNPKSLDELINGFDLPRHMVEHIYMFGGHSVYIKLRVKKTVIDDVIDWLGADIDIIPEAGDDTCIVRTKANEAAMKFWCLQFGENITVLEPESLRNSMIEAIRIISSNYIQENQKKESTLSPTH